MTDLLAAFIGPAGAHPLTIAGIALAFLAAGLAVHLIVRRHRL